jgi:hypothetical protein
MPHHRRPALPRQLEDSAHGWCRCPPARHGVGVSQICPLVDAPTLPPATALPDCKAPSWPTRSPTFAPCYGGRWIRRRCLLVGSYVRLWQWRRGQSGGGGSGVEAPRRGSRHGFGLRKVVDPPPPPACDLEEQGLGFGRLTPKGLQTWPVGQRPCVRNGKRVSGRLGALGCVNWGGGGSLVWFELKTEVEAEHRTTQN